jgi:hypothetical protein
MSLVVDVLGFRREHNKFVVKEFAAYDGKRISHFVFKPPFPFDMLSLDLQLQANCLTQQYHGIEWESGSTHFHLFNKTFKDVAASADRIYVTDREKANYIRKFTSTPVYELGEYSPLLPNEAKCFYHKFEHCMCALSNVFYLYHHFIMQE